MSPVKGSLDKPALPCDFCGQAVRYALVCDACGRPRKLASALALDSFALLGVPKTYALSRPALEAAYLQASKRVHPDYHRERDEDHAAARRLTALVNEAYATLKDPFRRAEYLIELLRPVRRGAPSASVGGTVDKAGTDGSADPSKPSREFLMEQFDLRETALDAGDAPARVRIGEEMEARLTKARSRLTAIFAELENEPDEATASRDAADVRRLLQETSYYRGLLRDIVAADERA